MNKLKNGASSDAVLLMFVRLITMVLSFTVTRLLSEHLSIYDYGTYSQVMLLATTVSSMTILGMVDGVNFFFCRERDIGKREHYVSTIFALQCILSTAVGSVIMLCGGLISAHFENPDVKGLMIFAAVLPLLQNLISMLQVLMVSVGKAKMLAARNLAVALIRLGVVIIVIAAVKNVAVILAATLILDIAQIALFALMLRRGGCSLRMGAAEFGLVGTILRYCAPMAVFTVISTLNRDIDKYMIALWTDTETLAVYANASKVLPFDIVMGSFCTVLLPEITRRVTSRDLGRASELYRLFLEISYISTVAMCCAALAAAPQLMELLYSEKYMDGLSVFCIYILVDILRFTNLTLILSAAGKTKKLMFLGGAMLLLNAVLNILLFRLMGLTGPAAATLITTFVTGALILSFGAKELETSLGKFFDLKYLLLFLAENAAALFALSWVQRRLAETGLHYLAVVLIVCGAYGVLMLLLNGRRFMADLKQVNVLTGKKG